MREKASHQRGGYADGLRGGEGDGEVGALVVRRERRVRHARLAHVRVQQRAQRQPVVPRRAAGARDHMVRLHYTTSRPLRHIGHWM